MCILYLCIINVVNIATQPMNVTICLTQNPTATFTCVVDKGGTSITNAGWHILDGDLFIPIPVTGRDRYMTNAIRNGDMITDTLTVTDVSVNDSGALYRCEPTRVVSSIIVTITVVGEVIICLSCAYIKYILRH